MREDQLVEMIRKHFDLRPAGIIKMLDLRRPIYKQTAAYGHFGRDDLDLPWEKLESPNRHGDSGKMKHRLLTQPHTDRLAAAIATVRIRRYIRTRLDGFT